MMILSKYLIKKCISNILILLFITIIIIFVFNVMNEVNDLKTGSYSVFNMLVYICLLLPSYIYTVLPISILLGINIAIFSLVKSSEYVVIINSGLPKTFILQKIFFLTSFLALITFALGNYVIPYSETEANTYKAIHISHNSSLHYLWLKENENKIFRIEELDIVAQNGKNEIKIKNIAIFTYNHKDLISYLFASSGIYLKNKFVLSDAKLYNYQNNDLHPTIFKEITVDTTISDKYLLNIEESHEMSVSQLINFINYLKHSKQNSTKQEITLYSKVIYPIFCILMGFVAILFVPYHTRHSSGAVSVAINVVTGLIIFFINKFAQYIAIYFHLPATSSVILLILTTIFIGPIVLKNN